MASHLGDFPHATEFFQALPLIDSTSIIVFCLYQVPLITVWHCLAKNFFDMSFMTLKMINLWCHDKYFSPQKLQNRRCTQCYLRNYMVLLGKWVAPTRATMTEKHVLSISPLINSLSPYLVHENILNSARRSLTRVRKHKPKVSSPWVSVYLQASSVAKLHVACI